MYTCSLMKLAWYLPVDQHVEPIRFAFDNWRRGRQLRPFRPLWLDLCFVHMATSYTHLHTYTHTHTYTQHVTNCIVSIRISSCLSLCVPFSCWALSAAYLKLSFATLACTWIYLFMNFEGRQAAFSASASASASSSSSSSHFIFFIISAFTYWFTSSYICSPVSCSHTHTHTHSSWAP